MALGLHKPEMRTVVLIILAVLGMSACNQDSPKVARQKAIYFSVSDVPRREQERELARTMENHHFATPGLAMIFLLDQSIAFLPHVDAIVGKAATQASVQLPPKDPLDQAEDQIQLAREVRALATARQEIARIEAEPGQ
jgi:hypothetical protein